MYTPAPFRQQDPAVLHAFIHRHSFATLITHLDADVLVTHLPVLFDPAAGPHGSIRAHIARANPQFEHLRASAPALALFHGPHTYISPSWYADPANVPTWNYAVVHARGTSRLLPDSDLPTLLRQLVEQHEAPLPGPWSFDPAAPHISNLFRSIAAFEIPVDSLQGKLKLNQNRTTADRQGVLAALDPSPDPDARAIADLMRAFTAI